MITTKKELNSFLNYEKKIYHKKKKIFFRPVLSETNIAWKYICLLRFEEYFHNTNKKIKELFFRILKVKLGRKYNIQIPINVIDKGLLLMHPFNIMINAEHIGFNCLIQFGCSCVAGGHDGGAPIIGNNVCFGVNSTIIGKVIIGNGIAIGAGAVVNHSFTEENICIAGVPAKKISNNGSLSWGGTQKLLESLKK